MTERIETSGLQVDKVLYDFLESQVLAQHPTVKSADFWPGFAKIIKELGPKNKQLLQKRDEFQAQLSAWHQQHPGPVQDQDAYKKFLQDIGYLEPEPEPFTINPSHVDREFAEQAGPQLVVPILNARYAINACNARWGSLYDALYGTDAIDQSGELAPGESYNAKRGDAVIAFGREFLDQSLPLQGASHQDAKQYQVQDGRLQVTLQNGQSVTLVNPELFIGYQGEAQAPSSLLFLHNGLHIDVQIDAQDRIGQQDPAHIKDIILEAALSTIMDMEDSVAAVDGEDKTLAYKNWLGLMRGDLTEEVSKNGKTFIRRMNPDREYTAANGKKTIVLGGRSLMLVRNVGHLMTNPAILDQNGDEVYEGIMDAVVTALIAPFDLNRQDNKNSRAGSVYIVKPKMHGPAEVAFANELFTAAEQLTQLPANTLKMGLMDEERRTSINLRACILQAKDRLVFINTGFLDRTGDEIHTIMSGGAVVPKNDIKNTTWFPAYEKNNVQTGVLCGLIGRAQIGKGMWAMPDLMHKMLTEKIAHPKSGANTAWVPSPTGATLHAIHYHQVNVFEVQKQLLDDTHNYVDEILVPPLAAHTDWEAKAIQHELDNNCQSLLGYVVRWVEQGVGCSKVPDINNIGLMEDRATLRISSQHICNWLVHGVVTKEQVQATLERMAAVVDAQNQGDAHYVPMVGRFEQSPAFRAACDLIYKGQEQPSGYTEPLLHHWRQIAKKQALSS
ncbi:malate synthase G [Brackiella oedipodis]|uniref:malate synthase G n=1 Tax=Brackiella oedipodis TaxID=124225 RepID=UPI00048A902D|nr:malate synthase G [Brackiella oedipodis]